MEGWSVETAQRGYRRSAGAEVDEACPRVGEDLGGPAFDATPQTRRGDALASSPSTATIASAAQAASAAKEAA